MDNGGVVGLRSNLLVIIIVIVLFICPKCFKGYSQEKGFFIRKNCFDFVFYNHFYKKFHINLHNYHSITIKAMYIEMKINIL